MSFPGNGGERDRMNAAAATIEEPNAVLAAHRVLAYPKVEAG